MKNLHKAIGVGVAGLALAFSATASGQGYGTIKGKLIWKGATAPELPLLVKKGDAAAKDGAVCAVEDLKDRSLVVDPKTKGVQYAFAFLPRPTGKNADAEKELLASTPEVVIDQKNCEFLPYASVVFKDQKVVFKSSDAVIHNVRYTGFSNPAQNITLPANGKYETKFSKERLPVELKCDVHPWMSGWIMIMDHPFVAVTDAEGNFEIKGVPAGTQNLVVWQPKAGYVTAGAARGTPVTVKAGEVTTVPPIELDPSKIQNLPAAK